MGLKPDVTLDTSNLPELTVAEATGFDRWLEDATLEDGVTLIDSELFDTVKIADFVHERDELYALDYDENNRFEATLRDGRCVQIDHAYRGAKDEPYEEAQRLLAIDGGRFYVFPTINDYGVPEMRMISVLLVQA